MVPTPGHGRLSRGATAILLALAFAAVALWWLWPLPALWRDHSVNTIWWKSHGVVPEIVELGAADVNLIIWELAWGTHALVSLPFGQFFEANIFHPTKHALAYSEHLLGLAPLFAPTFLATGNAQFATNILIFLTYPLCALAAYALARRWVDPPAAAFAAIVFAFHPMRFGTPPQVYMLGAQWLPLVILLVLRWLERARAFDAVLLAIAVAMQMLTSFYFAYIVAILLGLLLPPALWRFRDRLDARRLVGLALALGMAGLPVVLMARPYLELRALGLIPTYDPTDLQAMTGLQPANAAFLVRDYLLHTGPSAVGWLLALLAVGAALRAGGALRRPIGCGIALAVAGVVLALGPIVDLGGRELTSPVLLLFRWVPGFASMRGLGRFLVLTQLGIAVTGAAGFQLLARRLSRRVAWAAAVAVGAASLALSAANRPEVDLAKQPSPADLPGAVRWLAENGHGRPLMELPGSTFSGAGRRMYLSTYHWLPIIDGYSGYPPRTAQHLYWVAWNLPGADSLQALVNNVDLGWILVHTAEMTPEQAARWSEPLPDGLQPEGQFGDDLLFSVTRRATDDMRTRILSTTRTPGRVELTSVGPRCPGALRFVDATIDFPHRTGQQWFVIEAVNRGHTPWPAFGFFPAHLVKGEARILRDGRPIRPAIDFFFPADLRPGEPMSSGNWIDAGDLPPGNYEIEARLVQTADGPLSACGVAPVRRPLVIP
ncbi:MAG: hypothetical protein WCH13_02420 [Deltaproteobacteria bacterium]